MAASELAEWDAETALVGAKLQLDHEKAGVHITDAGARAALRHAMEANQHYPSAFNAALVGGDWRLVCVCVGGGWGCVHTCEREGERRPECASPRDCMCGAADGVLGV